MCPKGNLESEVGEFNEEEQTFEVSEKSCVSERFVNTFSAGAHVWI